MGLARGRSFWQSYLALPCLAGICQEETGRDYLSLFQVGDLPMGGADMGSGVSGLIREMSTSP